MMDTQAFWNEKIKAYEESDISMERFCSSHKINKDDLFKHRVDRLLSRGLWEKCEMEEKEWEEEEAEEPTPPTPGEIKWIKIFEDQRKSGLTQKEYMDKHGYKRGTYSGMRSTLIRKGLLTDDRRILTNTEATRLVVHEKKLNPTEEKWVEVLKRQDESGLTNHAFAKKEGISKRDYFNWKKRLLHNGAISYVSTQEPRFKKKPGLRLPPTKEKDYEMPKGSQEKGVKKKETQEKEGTCYITLEDQEIKITIEFSDIPDAEYIGRLVKMLRA